MPHGSVHPLPPRLLRPALPLIFPLVLWLIVSLVLASFLASLPAPAFALDRELRIVTAELGACGHLEEGRPTGFCYELGNALAREAGLDSENRLVPLARGVEEVATGKADLIIIPPEGGIVDMAEDLGPVKAVTMVVWARVETPLRDARDLGGKTVAVVRGSRHEFDRARELGFVPFPCRNHELGFKMLMAGRVDAVLGPLQGLTEAAERLGLRRRFLGQPLVLERDFMRVYVSTGVAEPVRGLLRKALRRLVEDGTVARLRGRYPI